MEAEALEERSLRPVTEPTTKTALAVQALRSAILRGELTRDIPLTTARIAQQLGMSQTPVREAIRVLQAEGLLHHEPYHSVSVIRYSAKDIHDIFQLRADLEAQATSIAVSRLTSATFDQLDALQMEMRHAARRGDLERLNRLNTKWHLLIYSAADNRVLLEVVQHLWKKFMSEVNWIQPDHAERSLEQHDLLLAALRERNSELAVELLRAHIQHGEQAAIQFIAQRDQQTAQ